MFNKNQTPIPGSDSPYFPTRIEPTPGECRFACDPAWDITPTVYQEALRLRRWIVFEAGRGLGAAMATLALCAGVFTADTDALAVAPIGAGIGLMFHVVNASSTRNHKKILRNLPAQGLPILPYAQLSDTDKVVFDELDHLAEKALDIKERRQLLTRLYQFTEISLQKPQSTPEAQAYLDGIAGSAPALTADSVAALTAHNHIKDQWAEVVADPMSVVECPLLFDMTNARSALFISSLAAADDFAATHDPRKGLSPSKASTYQELIRTAQLAWGDALAYAKQVATRTLCPQDQVLLSRAKGLLLLASNEAATPAERALAAQKAADTLKQVTSFVVPFLSQVTDSNTTHLLSCPPNGAGVTPH